MKNKAKRQWFKQHDYGYGWSPVTWQGWVTLLAYVVLVIAGVEELLPNENAPLTIWAVIRFGGYMTIWTSFLYRICLATGGKPKWRWGKK